MLMSVLKDFLREKDIIKSVQADALSQCCVKCNLAVLEALGCSETLTHLSGILV